MDLLRFVDGRQELVYHLGRSNSHITFWDTCWLTLHVFDQFMRQIDLSLCTSRQKKVLLSQITNVPAPLSAAIDSNLNIILIANNLPKSFFEKAYGNYVCGLSKTVGKNYLPDKFDHYYRKFIIARHVIRRVVCVTTKSYHNQKLVPNNVLWFMNCCHRFFGNFTLKNLRTYPLVVQSISEIKVMQNVNETLRKEAIDSTNPFLNQSLETKESILKNDVKKETEKKDKHIKIPKKPKEDKNKLEMHAVEDHIPSEDNNSKNEFSRQSAQLLSTFVKTTPEKTISKKYIHEGSGPIIVIETFRSLTSDKIIKGPAGHTPGVGYLDNSKTPDRQLSEILTCATTSSYLYGFSDANLRPHFVIEEKGCAEYIKIMEPEYGSKIDWLRFGVNHVKRKPVEVNDDEGNPYFYFFSDKSTKCKYFFETNKVNYDYWMKAFDNNDYRKGKGKDDIRGFTDVLDIGLGRNGVNNHHCNSQRDGSHVVCGKPLLINNEFVEEHKQISVLLDLMQDVMDLCFSENDKKLFSNFERDAELTAMFREHCGSEISRAEAVTIVRQLLGTLADVLLDIFLHKGTLRHW